MLAAERTKRKIIEYIRKNKFSAGSQIPTEMELIKILGVSRQTLREATNILKNEGCLYSVQGKGTYVSDHYSHIPNLINNNLGITEMITYSGYEAGTSYYRSDIVKLTPDLAKKLKADIEVSVIRFTRVKTADNNPVAYCVDYIAPHLAGNFLSTPQKDISLYDFIENTCKTPIGNCITELKAVVAKKDIAELLRIEEGAPLMLMDQLVYDKEKQPLLYSHEYLIPDMFRFTVNRKR